ATIDHRLHDRLPVQLYFAHYVLRLRRLQYALFDEKFCKLFMRHRFTPPGSARVSRAGFGVAPKQSFVSVPASVNIIESKKVRDREDALTSTRDACATQLKTCRGH